MQNTKIIFISIAASVLLGACSSPKDANEKNFKAAIQDYLSQDQACMRIFDRRDELPTIQVKSNRYNDDLRIKTFDALVSYGIFTVEKNEEEGNNSVKRHKVKSYTLTDKGKEFVQVKNTSYSGDTNELCYGEYEVVDIENFTEPTIHPFLGAKTSDVQFTYKAKNVADWAKSDVLKNLYKNVKKDINSKDEAIQDSNVLVLTNNGWVHENFIKN